jgi:hypothetical protein
VISGFRRDADEICALLRYNAPSSGNTLLTFRDNVSVPSTRAKKYPSWTTSSLNMGPIPCPETSVKDYHSTLRYTSEGRSSTRYQCPSEYGMMIFFHLFLKFGTLFSNRLRRSRYKSLTAQNSCPHSKLIR